MLVALNLFTSVNTMSKKTSNKNLGDINKEDVVQAVVIADNFNDDFAPVINNMPSCLVPLANTLVLDLTLEWLSVSGVQEIFLFCTRFADQIRNHIKNSRWGENNKISITVIVSETCQSVGEAMRDLDAKGVIRGDFILTTGDTVANVNLVPVLKKHRQNQKVNKGLAMTLLYKHAGYTHNTRAPQDDLLLVLDPKTGQVLLHQKQLTVARKKVQIPMELLLERPCVDVRCDLRDTSVSICSPSVLPLFSDNFDFQTRDDFVRGLLMNEEILASTLSSHILKGNEYAASVSNWHQYQTITRDILHRWTYPIVPDLIMSNSERLYIYLRNNVYKQYPVTLSKACVLNEDSIVGSDTSVGVSSRIERTVIGKKCTIGKNVIIEDSFIWDGTKIDDGCVIQQTVVANNCKIGKNTQLLRGTIIGSDVVIPSGNKIVAQRFQSEPEMENEQKSEFGPRAFLVRPPDEDSDSEDLDQPQPWTGLFLNDNKADIELDSDDSSEASQEESRSASPMLDDTKLFYNEVVDSLKRGFEEKLHCDNLILEINSSRYAYNVSVREVNQLVMKAILSLPRSGDQAYLVQLQGLLTYFMPILENYVRNTEAQTDCLQALEEVAGEEAGLLAGLPKVLNFLYGKDILSEECIIEWSDSLSDSVDQEEEGKKIQKAVEPFIKWLQEAEEESDSTEDDSD